MTEPMTDEQLRGSHSDCYREVCRLRKENEQLQTKVLRAEGTPEGVRFWQDKCAKLRKVAEAFSSRKEYYAYADLDEFSIIPDGRVPTHYLVEFGPLDEALRELDEPEK